MKRLFVLLLAASVALTLVLGVLYIQAPPATPVKAGEPAPDVDLMSTGGRVRLSGLRGVPVLLVLFDSSWSLSRVYIVEIERLHRLYAPVGLAVLGIGLDKDAEALAAFKKKYEITFPVLQDAGGRVIGPIYGVPRKETPWVYILSPTGRVEAVYADLKRWREGGVRQKLKELVRPLEQAAPH
jgi:peroxiredoxin